MKINDQKKKKTYGGLLGHFTLGDCVRCMHDDRVYIVGTSNQGRLATSLSDGLHKSEGLFVLEPNAEIVIR